MRDTPIITPDKVPEDILLKFHQAPRKSGKAGRWYYRDVICAFDIETSYLEEYDRSIMYLWQFQLGHEMTILGRTWDEFVKMMRTWSRYLSEDLRLQIWVHNLSYEFHYLRGIYDFKPDEVFCIKPRRILQCYMMDRRFDFKCSYYHANLSLDEYVTRMRTDHKKLKGTIDYSVKRYPWTSLERNVIKYGVNDAVSLVEAIENDMAGSGDDMYTIPATNTGYVRRDIKNALRSAGQRRIAQYIKPSYECYQMLKEAFRGGDTHANRFYVRRILKDVKSADRKSSYPAVDFCDKFPMSEFKKEEGCDFSDLIRIIFKRGKATVFRIRIYGLELIDPLWGFPYFSKHKCRNIKKAAEDNGRILSADYLEITLTDVDLKIMLREYKWKGVILGEVYTANYDYLPQSIRDRIIHWFINKETINKDTESYLYDLSKRMINAIYGMFAMDPLRDKINYVRGEYKVKSGGEEDYEELQNLYLSYAWGCWTTAHARHELHKGLWICGHDAVYTDTDSVKYVGDHDFTAYNKEKIKIGDELGGYAVKDGKRVYLGVYEEEKTATRFATLGSKKYVCEYGDEFKITIAGVNKEKGAVELQKGGGIEEFIKNRFEFKEAGGMEARYSDMTTIKARIEGHDILLTPCVSLVPSTYKLGLEREYERLLNSIQIAQE